ncbi:MAG: hypothetical protein Q8O74_07515, partial [bacterium]|nr:hypothetical protein [bacterium]
QRAKRKKPESGASFTSATEEPTTETRKNIRFKYYFEMFHSGNSVSPGLPAWPRYSRWLSSIKAYRNHRLLGQRQAGRRSVVKGIFQKFLIATNKPKLAGKIDVLE